MSLVAILQLGMVFSIVLMLFALALRAKVADLTFMVTHWRLGLGAAVAMFVVVPAAAILMAWTLELNRAVEIAIIALAFSPLPPILPGKQIKAGGQACYITGLLFGATILSIIVAPLGVALVSRIFHVDAAISLTAVANPLVISILLPLILGLILAPVLKGAVPRVSDVTGKVGSLLLLIVMIGIVIVTGKAMWHLVGDGTLAALAVMTVVGLAAGYLLGGPDPGNKAALALAASSRHPGVAIAIASNGLADSHYVPAAVVLSMIVSTVLCVPFLKMMHGQAGGSPATAD